MASKEKTRYICNECGNITAKWMGKCSSCESWGSIDKEIEFKMPINETKDIEIKSINEIITEKEFRIKTSFIEFDRVLGGGLTKGEVVLITGNPGIGKSTFLLQLSNEYAKNRKVIYVSGEESIKQVKDRANRLSISESLLFLVNETLLENIIYIIEKDNPSIMIIDSIQTIYSKEISSMPGSINQIREATLKFIEIAKSKEISFYIVGHVTKDGKLAGPKILEHMVDAVLSFEGDENNYYRIIRSNKNRYGSTNEISIFDMKEDGISEVRNPSEFFISEREEKNVGSIITTSVEGSRVILYEIQTLISLIKFGIAKRVIEGYDRNRVELLATVLSKLINVDLYQYDIYLNIPGGILLKDQSIDLAIILSLLSTFRNIEISQKIAAIGEVGLRGEVRKVSFIKKRIIELEKLGFKGVYIPYSQKSEFDNFKTKLKLNYISNISELVERI